MFLPGNGTARARSATINLAHSKRKAHKMAPLPPNSTPRFRFTYAQGSFEHSFQIRSEDSPATVGNVVDQFLTAFGTGVYATTLIGAEFAADNSDIFNPVVTGFEGNTYGTGAAPTQEVPWAFTFVGRTPGGRRCRLALFGAKSLFTNYRATPAEAAFIADALDVLTSNTGIIMGIDANDVIWKPYANIQVNDHWLKEVRS